MNQRGADSICEMLIAAHCDLRKAFESVLKCVLLQYAVVRDVRIYSVGTATAQQRATERQRGDK